MAKFTEMDQRRALQLFLDGLPITKICDQMGISRPVVQGWKKVGLPVSLTKGLPWDEYRKTLAAERTRNAMERRSEKVHDDALDFFENAKEDIRLLFENAKARLMAGQGLVSFSDVEKLMNIFIRLDNQGADRVIWMQKVMTDVIRAVAKIVKDERQLLQIRNELIAIAANEQKKLGSIPGASKLPTPAEIALGRETQYVVLGAENEDQEDPLN